MQRVVGFPDVPSYRRFVLEARPNTVGKVLLETLHQDYCFRVYFGQVREGVADPAAGDVILCRFDAALYGEVAGVFYSSVSG
jgi:hypothetical protein